MKKYIIILLNILFIIGCNNYPKEYYAVVMGTALSPNGEILIRCANTHGTYHALCDDSVKQWDTVIVAPKGLFSVDSVIDVKPFIKDVLNVNK